MAFLWGLKSQARVWVSLSYMADLGMPQFPSLYNADYNSNYISGVSFSYYWKAFIRMSGTSRCSIYIHYYQLKYYCDYSKFQWLPFIFIFWASQTTWKRPHYLTADANHRCSENDYKVLRSLSSSSLSQKTKCFTGTPDPVVHYTYWPFHNRLQRTTISYFLKANIL